MKELPGIFATYPTVYAVGRRYVILVPVEAECLMWVRVGDREFFDDSNGVLRSASTTHKMEVPQELLDVAGEYTVCWRKIIERKPYFSDVGEIETYTSVFRPVRGDRIRMYHIADAHNRVDGPVAAGRYFGDDLDVLVLNGDIPNHSGKIEYFTAIHRIAGEITGGELPVIFSRGNHDTRGIYAEKIEDHTPTDCGRSYYSVRLGKLWALVLDCAEDKSDDHAEYGHTICCHNFLLILLELRQVPLTLQEFNERPPILTFNHRPLRDNPQSRVDSTFRVERMTRKDKTAKHDAIHMIRKPL